MLKYLTRLIRVALPILLLAMMVVATPVMAVTPMPPPDDSIMSILEATVFPSCLTSGDIGILAEYSIPYATTPPLPVNSAYTFAFVAADGTTQLQATTAYAFANSGYSLYVGNPSGVVWFYFTPAQVSSYSLASTNLTNYGVWIIGNPTVEWSTTAPISKGSLTSWGTASTTRAQLGFKIIDYSNDLSTLWSLLLTQTSPVGTVLTSNGEQYYTTSIPNLRAMTPQIFSAGQVTPYTPNLTYKSSFGARLENGTGTAAGAPITLASGTNTVNVLTNGTLTITLNKGTSGNATSNVSVVTGSPASLVEGVNTITVTGAGNIFVNVVLSNTQSRLWAPIAGTVFDLSPLATLLGIPVSLLSGLVWIVITILICVAGTNTMKKNSGNAYDDKSGKLTMILFDICLIGGSVVGLLPLIVAIIMFIGCGFLTGYILFFRSSGA